MEACAPLSSCTAIVAAWLKPLLFGRCRIHAPPRTFNIICKRSLACRVSHQGKGEGTAFTITFLLSLFLSSFGRCGRCRLPRLRIEFAPPPFFFSHLHSFVHTAARIHLLAHLHLAPILQCACHPCHNVTLAFPFTLPSFLRSRYFIFLFDWRVRGTWIDMALGSFPCGRCAVRVISSVVCGTVAHVGSGVVSKRQAAAVARLRLL